MFITDKQFSATVIETGKVKAGCQICYQGNKHQNPRGRGEHFHVHLYEGITFQHKFLNGV